MRSSAIWQLVNFSTGVTPGKAFQIATAASKATGPRVLPIRLCSRLLTEPHFLLSALRSDLRDHALRCQRETILLCSFRHRLMAVHPSLDTRQNASASNLVFH